MQPLVEITNDGGMNLNFHPGQTRIWNSDARFNFMFAGTQSGKTCLGPWWLYREIMNRGAGDYLAVAANYDLFKLKMMPEMKTCFVDTLGIGRFWAGMRIFEIAEPETREFWAKSADDPMYARIILRSAVAGKGSVGVTGLESATAKGAWLDEVGMDSYTLATWESILRRLALNEGRVLGTTTLYNFDWMKTEVYDRWLLGDPNFNIVQFDSIENPAFPKGEYLRAQATMPPWRFDMTYRGIYTKPAGMIYSDFDTSVHVCDPFDIPLNWNMEVGIDFGAVNTASVWLAQDPATRIYYVFHETHEGNKTSSQHAHREMDFGAKYTRARKRFWGGAPSESQNRMDWQEAGCNVMAPIVTSVEPGITRVTTQLRGGHLYFFRSCPGTIRQMGSYSRVLDSTGESTDVIEHKEKYHYLDALRYALNWTPITGEAKKMVSGALLKNATKGKMPSIAGRPPASPGRGISFPTGKF